MLQRLFKLTEHQTTIGRELQAGATTFAAMAYILAVNPAILANTGMDKAALVTVTALTAAASTVIMALLTNYPIALAPGMGINAFFTFSICIGRGVPWTEALGMVFVNGFIFLLLTVTGVREKIIAAIPHSMKIATTCGIGVFIAFIGLRNGGIIVANPETFVAAGNFTSPPAALCLAGIALTAILVGRRVPGAIVLGILAITVVGLFVRAGGNKTVTVLPASLVSFPASPAPVFLELTFNFLTRMNAIFLALPLILTLLLVDMFDNIGTFCGIGVRLGIMRADGKLPEYAGRALLADAIATILSALAGTSTVVSYIESAAGVEAGGRTGLTSLTTAVLMLAALFFTPLILAVPAAATAPALVIVGVFMMRSVIEIDMSDFNVALPAVLTIIGIPLTFSIAEGIGLGLIAAAILSFALRETHRLSGLAYLIAAVFFLQFFKIWPFG